MPCTFLDEREDQHFGTASFYFLVDHIWTLYMATPYIVQLV
jgi:hypothetical protein